jgi:hypothetical protein
LTGFSPAESKQSWDYWNATRARVAIADGGSSAAALAMQNVSRERSAF